MNRLKFFQFFFLGVWLLTGGSACRSQGEEARKGVEIPPAAATHRALVTEKAWLNTSRPLEAEDLAGRIVLVDFWTYACINCIHVMPDLRRLEEEFGNSLVVLGVHSGKFDNEHDIDNIRAAVLRHDLQHPVVNDAEFKIWKAFRVNAWPTWILIDPEGEVDRSYSGEGNYEEARKDILVLQKKFATRLRQDPLPLALEKDKMAGSTLGFPAKLAFDPERGWLWVSDSQQHRLVALQLDGKVVATIGQKGEAGFQDGDFAQARFRQPQGLLYGPGKLYVADTENHAIRVIDLEKRQVNTLAGTGKQGYARDPKDAPALQTPLSSPWDLAFFPDASHLALAMAGTHQLWSLNLDKGQLNVLAGNGRESIDDGAYPENSLSQPSGLSVTGAQLYFVDSETSSLRRLVSQAQAKGASFFVKTLIGTGLFDFGFKDGDRSTARMQHPIGLWAEPGQVYIADTFNHAIRRYDMKSGVLSTFAGDGQRGIEDGAFAKARFNEPNDIIKVGEKFYVADTNNHRIRVLDPLSGQVSTLEVREADAESIPDAARPTDKLPNVKIRQELSLAPDQEILWRLELPSGWKVNADAPSRLRLFDVSASEAQQVAAFPKEKIATREIRLPALRSGGTYLLQGLLYYCREGAESLCYLGGAEAKIQTSPSGETGITWKVGP